VPATAIDPHYMQFSCFSPVIFDKIKVNVPYDHMITKSCDLRFGSLSTGNVLTEVFLFLT